MSVEHVSGCNQRHGARQRCDVPSADSQIEISVDSPTPPSNDVQRARTRSLIALVFVAVVVIVTAVVVMRTTRRTVTPTVASSLELETWASVPGGMELDGADECPGVESEGFPCRRVRFAIDTPYEETIRDMRSMYLEHGWSVEIEPHDFSLHATAIDEIKCVLAYRDETAPAGGERSTAVIAVETDYCLR